MPYTPECEGEESWESSTLGMKEEGWGLHEEGGLGFAPLGVMEKGWGLHPWE